ncbi:hypothetical protein LSCM1_03426 [Leishmania martiniquensis]|uniref:Carbohydrate-binding/sugar hydrolysis domain-containing protein n=1 Tax=Leishmania martiniquensis TaxID=1580590 RepID=A0A836KRA5_9TRYP|nr:hypothetical protein LSCM1_03426 [Leishmania martiniquensis]
MHEEAGYAVVQRYSSWQKKKVRTIIVNAHAKNASHRSIADAIALAKPYDRIELTGGDYHESIAIQMPLELVASEGEDPHILSRSSTITIATNGIDVYMERIVVSSRSSSKLDAAIVAVAGNPILFRCHCTSVLIGGNAVAHLDECTVKESDTGVGIVVQESGGGIIKSSTIRNHRNVCFDIDTRGELTVTECTIDNNTGGDAMNISGAVSSISRDYGASYTSCSHVKVAHCHLSISSDTSSGTSGGASMSITGSACGIVLTQGAAPTIISNEFIEGEIGVLIEGPGTAQLKGNLIRCQRRCGILALVEDGFGYAQGHQTLRITGDNVLDRCRIGIDVQCFTTRASYVQQQSAAAAVAGGASGIGGPADVDLNLSVNGGSLSGADRFLADELPNPRQAFTWIPLQGSTPPPCSRDAASFPPLTSLTTPLVCVEGEWYALEKLRSSLQQLVTMTLQAYPTCLQPSFGIIGGTPMIATQGLSATSANPFADILNEMLGTQLSHRQDATPPPREMLQLRGNKGIDIINTKFSNCDVCAIRFGRQGYGLVGECIFEDCGTYAVVVDCAAHPLITGCRFVRSRGASILVSNFANPFIIGNEMSSGKRDGIQLAAMSRGLIVGNIITAHVGAGIRVVKHSQPLICANALSQNRKSGIAVAEGSKPTILFNSLAANLYAQVSCIGGADAFISHNRITSSTDAGIHIDSCSRCTVISNTINANGDGILVELDADPYVQDNDITSNARAGVRACNNALGVFVGNRILDNIGPNVLLAEGASSVFRANRIEGGSQGGVVVWNEGHGFFERNTIASNAIANVQVIGAYSEPEFLRNVISGSRSGCGVVCARSAGGNFLRNSIHGNFQCGVFIMDASNPTFRDNTIAREAVGVLVSDGGKGSLMHNLIKDCYGTGVLAQRQADPVFSNNKVTGCQMSGLHIAPDSVGLFERNDLTENDIGVQLGSSMDSAVIELHSAYVDGVDMDDQELSAIAQRSASRLVARRASAFSIKSETSVLRTIADASEQRQATLVRSALSVIRGNTITANLRGGVLLDAFPNGILEQNDIFQNNAYGIRGDATYAAARAQALLTTKLEATSHKSVMRPLPGKQHFSSAQLQTLMLIRANSIHGHDAANIFLDHFDGSAHETTITENTIYAAPCGVCVAHNSTVHSMSKNEVHTCMDGFGFASGGHGCYKANHIRDCAYSGVYISDMAHPDFTDANRIENCGFSGILVDVNGQGVFRNNTVRRCSTGVVVFCGPTTPFHVTHQEVMNAHILSSTSTFTENTIEENELHGVLLLSVISGCPLRSPLILSWDGDSGKSDQSSPMETTAGEPLHDAPTPYLGAVGGSVVARGNRLCATFQNNVIRRNRFMGVYHDRFEHWDLSAFDKVHAERKPSTEHFVKNAHGGYEVLLGTSQVLDNDDHQRQRQLKQVSLVENTITECSFGVGAGYGCHPYLQRNKIHHNTFFGLLLRFGSAVSAYANDICDNGLAGVYAASGAKGYIAKGSIESNNGWCRPEASRHASRSFTECIFTTSFFTQSMVSVVEENVRASTSSAGRLLRASRRAYEQMTRLAEVHAFTMTDALRYLAELVLASSGGLTLASGCAPSTLFDEARRTCSSAASVAEPSRRLLGGVALADYVDVSTADGGIGVWVQGGSRVTIEGNRIAKHQNSGVLITKGVLQHHSVLHKSFHMEEEKKANSRRATAASLSGSAKFAEVPSSSAVDIFSVQREAPPLACVEPGALFTSQMLCASGIFAAVQVATSNTFENLDASFASFLHHSLSLSSSGGLATEEKRQRVDSLHYAHIAGNVIRYNRDGMRVELFHRLQASASASGAAVAAASANSRHRRSDGDESSAVGLMPRAPKDASAQLPFQRERMAALLPKVNAVESSATLEAAVSVSPDDLDVIDCAYSTLDFTVVVEGNTVAQNRRYGVYAVHVVNVKCEDRLPSRSVLNESIAAEYDGIRSKLMLVQQAARVDVTLPFHVHAIKQKIGHGLFCKNDLFSNEKAQVYVTSRFVAVTQDGDRTLLQLDTTAAPSESNYASQVLIGVPVVASLLQLPPPGVLLWDQNKIHDAKSGVRLCGYLGPHSVRFQRNSFANIADDALCIEGHLACVTVGKGNVFEKNGVGIHVVQQQHIRLATCPAAAALLSLRTRIFFNTFRAAKGSSISLECVGGEVPLVYRNEFSGHMRGTAALFLRSEEDGGAAVVLGNAFSDNYIPVFLVGRSGSRVESAHNASFTLLENRFTRNHVGVIACSGAVATLERNLFDSNTRAGMEVMGMGTRPQIRQCVFREHRRDGDAADGLAAPARGSHQAWEVASVGSTARYPTQETLLLEWCNISLTLLPENARVLTATSEARLPVGLLIGPFTEPLVDACAFMNNDIGVDAVRDAACPTIASAGRKAHFEKCFFANHQVSGVLVRGSQGSAADSGGGGGSADKAGGAVDVSASLETEGTTVFEKCVFMENATAGGGGDVVAMGNGHATFRGNVFCGSVVGKARGLACFTQNSFITLSDGDGATLVGAGHDASASMGGAKVAAAAAVVIQEGGRILAQLNTIAHRKVGVQCMPGAEGIVTGNRVAQCVTGLLLEPFNRTDLIKNRVLDSVDCGAIAYGGRMVENVIIMAPTGVVVQHSSAYKGINAVPSHKRDALEFLCIRNSIVDCVTDGLLIATGGTFDGNSVSHCKNGINIVSPSSGGRAGSCPVIKNCNVYDNNVGVCMESESESTVRDNDIFDNELVGVSVAPTASGTLHDNRISSPMDQGAVEMPIEARVKSFGNVIRNQFSPAFQRGTRASRAKDYHLEQASLNREIRDLGSTVEEAHQSVEAVSRAMRSLQQELIRMHSRSTADYADVMTGPAGHALRVATVGASKTTAAVGSEKKDGRTVPAAHSIINVPSSSEEKSAAVAAAPRKRSLGAAGRQANSASARRISVAAAGARRQSKAGLLTKADPDGKATKNAAGADLKQVLIHVFANAQASPSADAIGQAVAGVLAKAPLSRYNFVSTISTTTSQLLQLLGGPRPMQPFLCVVAFDANFGDLGPSDRYALQLLHHSAGVSRLSKYRGATEVASITGSGGNDHPLELLSTSVGSNSGDVSNLFYTVLPRSFCKKIEESTNESGVMGVETYAAAHHPFCYTASVEEVLDALHEQMSTDMKASTASEANSRSRRSTMSGGRPYSSNSTLEGLPSNEGNNTSHGAPGRRRRSTISRGSSSGPALFTTEYVSTLFSQLTPEAFGFEPEKDARSMKKRKSLVSINTHEEGDLRGGANGARRGRRGSVPSRRSSTVSKTSGPGASTFRSRSSGAGSRGSNHATEASKKS